jgi:nicotinamide mononucleotide (NMN) deamidase PncC
MPKKIVATGVLPGHDGESRAQRWRSVWFGLHQPGIQVRDRRAVCKVDSKERCSKEFRQSCRQANANLH